MDGGKRSSASTLVLFVPTHASPTVFCGNCILYPRSLRKQPSCLIFPPRKSRGRTGGLLTCANAGVHTGHTEKRASYFKHEGRFRSERGIKSGFCRAARILARCGFRKPCAGLPRDNRCTGPLVVNGPVRLWLVGFCNGANGFAGFRHSANGFARIGHSAGGFAGIGYSDGIRLALWPIPAKLPRTVAKACKSICTVADSGKHSRAVADSSKHSRIAAKTSNPYPIGWHFQQ